MGTHRLTLQHLKSKSPLKAGFSVTKIALKNLQVLQWFLIPKSLQMSPYTTYDEVRAVLGVSDEELENATLSLPLYAQQLELELESVYVSLPSMYTGIQALDPALRTPQQQKLFDIVQVYSAYATGKILLVSAPRFAPKRISDGRAEVERVADPFATLRDDLEQTLLSLRARLVRALEALDVVFSPVAGRVYFGAAGLSINPITNI